MNKSEREKLANIVSDMIYSFESNRQLISTGKQILETFPSIADEVEAFRYPVAANNVVNVIRSLLLHLQDRHLLSRHGFEISKRTFDSVEVIFDAYLENFEGDTFYSHLYEIEENLSDLHQAEPTIVQLVQTNYWKEAVAAECEVGTPEFNYLTNTK